MSMKSGRQSATTAPPNKRLKLAGPAFKGTVRLSASQPVTHGGALALAGARPAAYARSVRRLHRAQGTCQLRPSTS